ncbi:MAG TPA: hypothetical protein VGB99_03455 [Acidobacteriota bacterium]
MGAKQLLAARAPLRIRTAVLLLFYTAALVLLRDRVPAGLCNDIAEEALRSIRLVESGAFEVLSFFGSDRLTSSNPGPERLNHSAETLYLYLQGWVIRALGATTLAVQITSWVFAAACVVLFGSLMRRVEPQLPHWAALLLAAGSVWLFHYARSGGRPISAPFFLILLTWTLTLSEGSPDRRLPALACGVVLGLSLYAYTACRILPLTMILYLAIRWVRNRKAGAVSLPHYGWLAIGFLVLSIPNLLAFASSPGTLLSRGAYVLPPSPGAMAKNLFWSCLLPFHYSSDYRMVAGFNPSFSVDGVSAGLMAADLNPLHPLAAALLILGLLRCWRRRDHPCVLFLACAWLVATLILGVSGPSLTRMFIVLPVYLAVAAIGTAELIERWPRAKVGVAATLALLIASHAYAYFGRFAASERAQFYFSPAATPIGQRARQLAHGGQRVLCVVSKDASVVQYLTEERRQRVRIAEFYFRPFNPLELPLLDFDPQVVLIERAPAFERFRLGFAPERIQTVDPHFFELRLSAPRILK